MKLSCTWATWLEGVEGKTEPLVLGVAKVELFRADLGVGSTEVRDS